MRHNHSLLISLFAVSSLLSACGSSSNNDDNTTTTTTTGTTTTTTGTTTTTTASTVTLTVPFQAKAGATNIDCSTTLTGLGTSGDSATLSNFGFYIYGITLTTSAGKTVNTTLVDSSYQDAQNGVALLDFQDKTDSCAGSAKPTNKSVTLQAAVDPATVNGISFTVGIPAALNHQNASAARAPYNRTDLFWSWQTGYKFMRLDVNPNRGITKTDGTTTKTFNFHLGSTGCNGDPTTGATVSCSNLNVPSVQLSGLKVTNNTTTSIVLDYAQLAAGVNLNVESGGAVGCMSGTTDPECPAMFDNLGLSLTNGTAATTQRVFSLGN